MKWRKLPACEVTIAALLLFPALACAAIKEEPIPELKPPTGILKLEEVKKESRRWLIWPLSGLAVGIAILLLTKQPPPPPIPAAVRARKALAELNGKGDTAGVARVFREYVESAMKMRGRSATVDEIVDALTERAALTDDIGERVRCFLDPVELATFAPEVPAPPVERVIEEATALIEKLETIRGGEV